VLRLPARSGCTRARRTPDREHDRLRGPSALRGATSCAVHVDKSVSIDGGTTYKAEPGIDADHATDDAVTAVSGGTLNYKARRHQPRPGARFSLTLQTALSIRAAERSRRAPRSSRTAQPSTPTARSTRATVDLLLLAHDGRRRRHLVRRTPSRRTTTRRRLCSCGDRQRHGGRCDSSSARRSRPSPPTPTSTTRPRSATDHFDIATLSGGYNPTGTVDFAVYKVDPQDGPATRRRSSTRTPASRSENGEASSTWDKPASPGTYFWIATYSGDDNNNGVAGPCGDEGETSIVKKASPTIGPSPRTRTSTTRPSSAPTRSPTRRPSRAATHDRHGRLRRLQGRPQDPSATRRRSSTRTPASRSRTARPARPGTSPRAPAPTSGSPPTSGDDNNNGVAGSCGDEGETSIVKKASPTIATVASNPNLDNAAVVGADTISTRRPSRAATHRPARSTSPSTRSTPRTRSATRRRSSTRTPASRSRTARPARPGTSPRARGTYFWIATYSVTTTTRRRRLLRRRGRDLRSSRRQARRSRPSPRTRTSTTRPSSGADTISDTATVSGGDSPTGTVDFAVYKVDPRPGLRRDDARPLGHRRHARERRGQLDLDKPASPAPTSGSPPTPVTTTTTASRLLRRRGRDLDRQEGKPTIATVASNPNLDNAAVVGADTTPTPATVSGGDSRPARSTSPSTRSDPRTRSATETTLVHSDTGVTLENGEASSTLGTSPRAPGTYFWIATYSGDDNNTASPAPAATEGETSIVKKAKPTIRDRRLEPEPRQRGRRRRRHDLRHGDRLGRRLTDRHGRLRRLQGRPPGPGLRRDDARPPDTGVTLENGEASSTWDKPASPGTYFWIATYSGDDNNNGVAGSCGDEGETSIVKKASPTIATVASNPNLDNAAVRRRRHDLRHGDRLGRRTHRPARSTSPSTRSTPRTRSATRRRSSTRTPASRLEKRRKGQLDLGQAREPGTYFWIRHLLR